MSLNEIRCASVVVGAGVAGLTTALQLPSTSDVVVLCKAALGSGAATAWAQGGIAAALGSDDAPTLHAADTLRAAAGIADAHVVEILARDAPARIAALRALGAHFDANESGQTALGLEAGHARRRIVKAGGDATGAEVLRTLVAAARERTNLRIVEYAHADDLILDGDRATGVYAHDVRTGEAFVIRAGATILAAGGCGRLYRYTTNPAEATGDGIAIAARAGVTLADMEFVQFHPTALAVDRDPLPLVTEAIRGEGAILLDEAGERFMVGIHPDAELAPRDIVARAIFDRQRGGRTVVLDAVFAIGDGFPRMFPTVFASCMEDHIDPRVMPIPVTPAAHYMIGGVATDERGRTSIAGLWACGETGATGVHGANRLASNSLLEALVFARRVADDIAASDAPPASASIPPHADDPLIDDAATIERLRAAMYEHVGVERSRHGLQTALGLIAGLEADPAPRSATLANLMLIGRLIAAAALDREESRGTHYRSDFPKSEPSLAHRSFVRIETARV